MAGPDRGRFITLEGIDGAGKTTCTQFVIDHLQMQGLRVMHTREPGGTSVGNDIRSLLLGSRPRPLTAWSELLLIMAARVQLVREVIEPMLDEGIWVLSDRFFDSTLAYQGAGRGIDLDKIFSLYDLCLGDFTPDLTFLLDVDVETGVDRASKLGGKDRFESEGMAFFRRVRAGFLQQAGQEPGRIRLICAARPLPEVKSTITCLLDDFCQSSKSGTRMGPGLDSVPATPA